MQFLFDCLLGIIHPINPFKWAAHIRHLRRSVGWAPPMMMIATVGVLLGVHLGLGLFGANAVGRVFNYLALATWFVVASVASMTVFVDGIHNVRRLGTLRISLPQWWFELSRLTWIGFLFVALSVPLIELVPREQTYSLGPRLLIVAATLFIGFLVLATIGYGVSAITGRGRSGRAFECVQYFHWIIVPTSAFVAFAVWLPSLVTTVVVCIVTASLTGITVLAVSNRRKQRQGRETDPPHSDRSNGPPSERRH